MKKIRLFTLAVTMLLGVGNVCAQYDQTFSFVDAKGNEVADGSTLTFYAEKEYNIPEMPELGYDVMAKIALSVRNNTNSNARVALMVEASDNPVSGHVQVCFPELCDAHDKGTFTTKAGEMLANEVRGISSEWIFDENKYSEEKLSLTIRGGMFMETGPKVNIRCIYADPAGIADMEADKNVTVVARYNGNGQVVTAPVKGVNILKLSNGKTIKKIVK